MRGQQTRFVYKVKAVLMNSSAKVKLLSRLKTMVNRTNQLRYKSDDHPISAKVKSLKNGEPVKAWEAIAFAGAVGLFTYWQMSTRRWEWEMDGMPGGIIGHNLGKYFYRKPIADQIKEQKRKDYEAGNDWKLKIFQE